ncbi:MAG: hypothetical protein HN611_05340 [Gemmatimonadetes bacterium]|nr:hypothetical protein [Gemmatimonadota bacterium]
MKLNTLILGRLMCVIILFGIELAGCSSDGGSKSMDSANRQATVTVNMKADFLTSSLAKPARPFELKEFVKIATCPAPQPAWDQPGYEAGLDKSLRMAVGARFSGRTSTTAPANENARWLWSVISHFLMSRGPARRI